MLGGCLLLWQRISKVELNEHPLKPTNRPQKAPRTAVRRDMFRGLRNAILISDNFIRRSPGSSVQGRVSLLRSAVYRPQAVATCTIHPIVTP